MTKPLMPTIDDLRQLIRYDCESGKLYWLPRTPDMFPGERSQARAKMWNTKWGGKVAFEKLTKDGYMRGSIGRKNLLAHRVAWAIHTGKWPSDTIDHINGNRSDNRIINLSNVTMRDNARNLSIRRDNTTGVAGVSFDSQHKTKPWKAAIKVDGKSIYLGRHSTIEAAQAARKCAEAHFGFAPETGKPSGGYFRP